MNTLREAAQQALEALEYRDGDGADQWKADVIIALRAALEEPVHKCKKCSAYFEKFSCGMKTIGECDCPKCQGYCECEHGIIPRHRNQQ